MIYFLQFVSSYSGSHDSELHALALYSWQSTKSYNFHIGSMTLPLNVSQFRSLFVGDAFSAYGNVPLDSWKWLLKSELRSPPGHVSTSKPLLPIRTSHQGHQTIIGWWLVLPACCLLSYAEVPEIHVLMRLLISDQKFSGCSLMA